MSDEILENEGVNGSQEDKLSQENSSTTSDERPVVSAASTTPHLSNMYRSWFLDYASYVILERAVPHLYDGLKPVQRRILHSMRRLDDGRYNKVANIVGHTMQFHPHGDASIGDALIQLGQKDLLIDCQGNWGNILTGDSAAASRYIEARLSKFALDVVFNPKTTEWQSSYDGRNKEPVTLPVKFPLLLAQGVEGIAVGLSSKILPHNFVELCDASVSVLRGEDFQLYPDFLTGGAIDVSRYNDGHRGGQVKVRATITKVNNRTLAITEIPYGKTTSTLIDSIIRAAEKNKFKIKRVEDNTAAKVEILIHLPAGVSSDKTIDALYAFTDCEVSISPNCCIIHDKKPQFLDVITILRDNTNHTKSLLKLELEIAKGELLEALHFASLESLFIKERMYKDSEFENAKDIDVAVAHLFERFVPFKEIFVREINRDDILRLMEIKMGRILKFNSKKAEDRIAKMKGEVKQINKNLKNIVDFTCEWFENLKNKYGAAYPRRTKIRNFETIEAAKVVEASEKLYFSKEDGFVGTNLKNAQLIAPCSSLDDIIIFYKTGKYVVTSVADKKFVGKGIIHLAVFKKHDKRTIYNVVYFDGETGISRIKRFNVTTATRDKEYDLTRGTKGSKVTYFTANPNGEAEIIRVILKPLPNLRKEAFEEDFSKVMIKGRNSMGNILTKLGVYRITLKQHGTSTLGGRKIWYDPDVQRINAESRGTFLGEFSGDESILVVTKSGEFCTTSYELTNHYNTNILRIEKFDESKIWTAVFINADKRGYYYLKRFRFEQLRNTSSFLGTNESNKLIHLTDTPHARFLVRFGGSDAFRDDLSIDVDEFISVKGFKAVGKRMTTLQVEEVEELEPLIVDEPIEVSEKSSEDKGGEEASSSLFDSDAFDE